MRIRVLDPTAEVTVATAAIPERLEALQGRTIGLLDNGKIHVRELLDHMEEILRSQHGVSHVLRFKKPDASRPAPDAVIADMKQCDAIISAVGD
ncbi:MAG: hypothetical protein O7G88_02625 [bacterium]|nr:hypothetical protein [bacterium]